MKYNKNKNNDIMFDVCVGWIRGDRFTMQSLWQKNQEKDNRIKAKYEVVEGEEVKEVQNDD